MKHLFLIVLFFVSVIVSALSCNETDDNIDTEDNNMTGEKISIRINSHDFTARMLDNSSAKAFEEMLPLAIDMIELNGNEKYYDLASNLPINASNPGVIQYGDLMLYGSNTLVLFYETFSTSYNYTKLGKIDDTTA